MDEREEKAEIFWSQYPECYIGEINTEVHPSISGFMHNYNKKFSELGISNVCKLVEVKIYRLPSVNGFYCENRQLRTCNMFTLKQCMNKLRKMAHLLTTDMDKAYPDKLLNMLITELIVAVTKCEGG